MSQKKFGQFKIVVWWPEPHGGRYEEWTENNKSRADFEEGINDMIKRLRRMVPAVSEDAGATPSVEGATESAHDSSSSLALQAEQDAERKHER